MAIRAFFIWVLLLSGTVECVADAPPNVVLIISDDQAWTDYGFMGHESVAATYIFGILLRQGFLI